MNCFMIHYLVSIFHFVNNTFVEIRIKTDIHRYDEFEKSLKVKNGTKMFEQIIHSLC